MFDWLPKTFIINMDKHTDRWKKCQEELTKYQINNYERFPGVIYNEAKEVKDRERGCSLSHFNIVEKAKQNNYPFILILEDDFEISPLLPIYENHIKNFITTHKWNLFYLGGNHLIAPKKIIDNIGQVSRTYTTHSYFIHKSTYDLLLSYFNENMQIDLVLYSKIQILNQSYSTIPNMIFQRAGESYIQGLYRDYTALRR
jgi:hypothetical protein